MVKGDKTKHKYIVVVELVRVPMTTEPDRLAIDNIEVYLENGTSVFDYTIEDNMILDYYIDAYKLMMSFLRKIDNYLREHGLESLDEDSLYYAFTELSRNKQVKYVIALFEEIAEIYSNGEKIAEGSTDEIAKKYNVEFLTKQETCC